MTGFGQIMRTVQPRKTHLFHQSTTQKTTRDDKRDFVGSKDPLEAKFPMPTCHGVTPFQSLDFKAGTEQCGLPFGENLAIGSSVMFENINATLS